MQYFLRLELPEDRAIGRAARTLRLAVCQYYAPQAAAGPAGPAGATAQLYSINLRKPARPYLEAEDIDCIDCVLCHGRPKEPGHMAMHGKRKQAGQDHPDTADGSKVYLWRFYNLSRMA